VEGEDVERHKSNLETSFFWTETEIFTIESLYSVENYCTRAGAHQGNWQPQRNSNFRELLSAWVEHKLLNGAVRIEEMATQHGTTKEFFVNSSESYFIPVASKYSRYNFILERP
jgi:hypothetical protein